MASYICKVFIILQFLLIMSYQWCYKISFFEIAGKQINQISWSPDGQYLVTASSSQRATVFNTNTSEVVWLDTLTGNVTTAKFSHNGNLLAVGQMGTDTIKIYNVPGFTSYANITAGHGSGQDIYEVDFNSDDTKLVACGTNGFVSQRIIATNGSYQKVKLGPPNNKIVWSCKYSDTNRIGIGCNACTGGGGGDDFAILATNLVAGNSNNKNYPKDVDWMVGGHQYLYGGRSNDNRVYQFNSGSSSISTAYDTAISNIWGVSISRNGQFLAAGGAGGNLYILNTSVVATLQYPLIAKFIGSTAADIFTVRVSFDGNYIATGKADGTIDIYAKNCLSCPMTHYINGSVCRECSADMIGCTICKNSTYCHTCFLNYYIDTTTGPLGTQSCKICDNALDGCTICKSKTVCLKCDQNYYLNGNTCSKCSSLTPDCDECLNNGTCIKCGFYTYLTPTAACDRCNSSIQNCLRCSQEYNASSTTNSTLYCRQCAQGYYASQASCISCPTNCLQCVNSGACITCSQEYKLVSGVCTTACPQFCQSCADNGTCLECMPTTFISSGSCSSCTFPCLTCNATATNCSACATGYFMSSAGVCSKCAAGCPLCHPTNGTCTQCPIGQYLTATNSCAFCLNTTSHCSICTASVCLACERNFYLNTSNLCAPTATVTDCLVYDKNSTTVCHHCNLGLYLDSGICKKCPQQCVECESVSQCTQCHLGFFFNSPTNSCLPCNSTCRTCSTSTSVCLSCGDEDYLSGTQCLKCQSQIPYCNSCLNGQYCLNCKLGYRIDLTNNTCKMCTSPCATCNSTGCLSCEMGFFFLSNSCTQCPNECLSCNSSSVCTSCVIGYVLNPSNVCVVCESLFPNCQYCSSAECTECKEYFMLNATSKLCTFCSNNITNCLECDNAGLCSVCKVGFFPANDRLSCSNCMSSISNCEKCESGTNCTECVMGFYLSSATQCSKCNDGCLVCSDSSTCDLCQSGFLKVGSVCTMCDQQTFGCRMCTTVGGCSECYTQYYLVSSTNCSLCRSAIEGCSVCDSSTVCVSCDIGYFLNSSNKCQKCSSTVGCSHCNPITQTCTQCMSGYFIDSSNLCQLCSPTYLRCSLCNSSQCLRCQTGSYFSAGLCNQCSVLSPSCIICNSSSCLQCQSGFYLHSNGTCQLCTLNGCQLCSPDGLSCLSCDNLYYKTGPTCTICESMDFGCISCNAVNQCLMCKTGFYLHTNGTCILCQTKFPSCDVCSSSYCEVCQSNHFHNASSINGDCLICSQFLQGCSLCINELQCLSCESGYYLQALQCHSCTVINQCMICENGTNCLFCAVGFYLSGGQCLSCSDAILGCFSCVSSTMCLTCSGSYTMSSGQCLEMKGTPPNKQYSEIKVSSEYINATNLKHTLYSSKAQFTQIEQKWNLVTTIELVLKNGRKVSLTILKVEWGTVKPINILIFYTDNPIGEITPNNDGIGIPMIGNFSNNKKRLLTSLQDLNMQINFNMKKSAIEEILPTLDTNGDDLALQYKLNEPEFYKSVIKTQNYYFFIFGAFITAILIVFYFLKICCLIPTTNDTGEIIPHILLMKVPAFVIYPTLGGYINFCYGFSLIDLPWLNDFFSRNLSDLSDFSPPSFQMFYNNLNFASTYLLAFMIFILLFVPLTVYSIYKRMKQSKNSPTKSNTKITSTNYRTIRSSMPNSQNLNHIPINRVESFISYIYNIFIVGLTFSSFSSMIGMFYNPTSVVSVSGAFYILGVLIYTAILIDAIKSFTQEKAKFNKLRVVIKTSMMAMMFWSPIPLFAAMALIDCAVMAYEYKLKLKEWVVPKIWLFSQIFCIVAYAVLIFLSSMFVGIIVASISIIVVLVLDAYLNFTEYVQIEKIYNLREISKHSSSNNLTIQGFVSFNSKQHFDSIENEFPFQNSGKRSDQQNENTIRRSKVTISSQRKNIKDIYKSKSTRGTKLYNQNNNLFVIRNIPTN